MKKINLFSKIIIAFLLFGSLLGKNFAQKGKSNVQQRKINGVALTPPMGWNSWNWFGKKEINETVVRKLLMQWQAMVCVMQATNMLL